MRPLPLDVEAAGETLRLAESVRDETQVELDRAERGDAVARKAYALEDVLRVRGRGPDKASSYGDGVGDALDRQADRQSVGSRSPSGAMSKESIDPTAPLRLGIAARIAL